MLQRFKISTTLIVTLPFLVLFVLGFSGCQPSIKVDQAQKADSLPVIYPDYTNITIPVNIAPLNFKLEGNWQKTAVKIETSNSTETFVFEGNVCTFSRSNWHNMLKNHVSDTLKYTLYGETPEGNIIQFPAFFQAISEHAIDSYLAFRKINTGYVLWEKMGIYQRSLESFDQSPIVENYSSNSACMNCHSFKQNDPDYMMLHIRNAHGGTILQTEGKFHKVDTKTPKTLSAGVYPAWHPAGTHIAYSVNKIGQQFHALSDKRITVSDDQSDLIVYDIEHNIVTTSPKVSTLWRENLPAWSPDGKFLYYVSAPQRKAKSVPNDSIEQYSLLRIEFNPATNQFGEVDTILNGTEVNGSISFPKPSPCGKYIAFTLTNSGYFTIHHKNADIYLLNLETREITKPCINSNFTDSYHSWSSTGRWMVFSSKRLGGLFTRPYFTHFEANGTFTKPFVLPQKDPDFYNSFLFNYNVPELITDKVITSQTSWRDAIWSKADLVNFDPSVDADALSGATTLNKKGH